VHIELLATHHRSEGFDCGEPALNQFLRQQAGQQQHKGFSKTYVTLAAKALTAANRRSTSSCDNRQANSNIKALAKPM